eukprot:scaffold1102_cov195-Alexandrium_tamarense.AAC.22
MSWSAAPTACLSKFVMETEESRRIQQLLQRLTGGCSRWSAESLPERRGGKRQEWSGRRPQNEQSFESMSGCKVFILCTSCHNNRDYLSVDANGSSANHQSESIELTSAETQQMISISASWRMDDCGIGYNVYAYAFIHPSAESRSLGRFEIWM